MEGLSPAIVEQLLPSMNALLATKYLAGSAIVLVIWDTLISLDQEVGYVWPLATGATKAVYLLNRYGMVAILLYTNYMLSGMGHPRTDFGYIRCQIFMTIMTVLTMVYSFASNCYIAFRLYAIWDQRKSVKILLRVVLAVTYIPVFVLGCISVKTFYNHTIFVPQFNTCIVIKENVIVKGGFACMFAFDVFVILLTTFNALDRPRGPQHRLVEAIRRDGAIWFFMLCLMRLANFLIYTLLPPEQVFVVVFMTWAMISITLNRMILRIEAMKKPPTKTKVHTWVPERAVWHEEWSRQSHGASNCQCELN